MYDCCNSSTSRWSKTWKPIGFRFVSNQQREGQQLQKISYLADGDDCWLLAFGAFRFLTASSSTDVESSRDTGRFAWVYLSHIVNTNPSNKLDCTGLWFLCAVKYNTSKSHKAPQYWLTVSYRQTAMEDWELRNLTCWIRDHGGQVPASVLSADCLAAVLTLLMMSTASKEQWLPSRHRRQYLEGARPVEQSQEALRIRPQALGQ